MHLKIGYIIIVKILLLIINKELFINCNDLKIDDYTKLISEKHSLLNKIPFVKLKQGNSNSYAHYLFSGHIYNDSSLNINIREGIKFIEPFTLADNLECSDKIEWLKKMFFGDFKLTSGLPVLLQQGETIGLICPVCKNKKSPKIWFKKPLYLDFEAKNIKIDDYKTYYTRVYSDMHNFESENRVIVTVDHNLIIKDFNTNDAGSYICVDTNLYYQILHIYENSSTLTIENIRDKIKNLEYFKSISNFNNRFGYNYNNKPNKMDTEYNKKLTDVILEVVFKINYHLILSPSVKQGQRSLKLNINQVKKDLNDSQSGLHFFTVWREWGVCSDCDNEGIRKRFGDCYVKYNKNVNNKLMELNRIFYPYGWPCGIGVHESFVSDETLQNMVEDVVQVEDCLVNCTEFGKENSVKEVKNSLVELISVELIYYISIFFLNKDE